jgi:HTH-type transcriptional regulator/antitoxin MqsA
MKMKCYSCGHGTLEHRNKLQVFSYKGKSISLEQSGMWCDFCEEGVLSGDDIAVTENAFDAFKLKVDDLLNPEQIRHIRKDILKLTQEEAGRIFGGGKNGFSRYERGETRPLPAISNLLKMFERHPEDLKYFINRSQAA